MSEIQFSNQENQVNFAQNKRSEHYSRYKNNQPQWRFVPVAIICAFVFIGAVIFAKLQTQKKLADEQPHAPSSPNTVGEILRENSLQPQDSIPATQTGMTANIPVAKPGITSTLLATGSGDKTLPANTPVPLPTPKLQPHAPTTKPVVVINQPAPAPNPRAVITPHPTPVTGPTHTTTTTTTTVVKSDESYKPANPYMETCGEHRDGRWHNLKVVLPAFEKDGKKAVEYWLQVGESVGSNNVFDRRFSQSERVVFSETYDNNKDYYVRFAIRMDGGDWQMWSNTLRLKCEIK